MTNNLVRKIAVVLFTLLLVGAVAAPSFAQFLRTDRVLAYDTDTWRVWTPAGDRRLIVEGDGDTDLDCWVYDRYGNPLGRDTGSSDVCVVDFRHQATGNVTIRIRNLGSVYNEYRLMVH